MPHPFAKIEAAGQLKESIPFWGCRVYRSSALSLTNGGTTPIAWDAESFDPQRMHYDTTNPSFVRLRKVGKWLVVWRISYAGHATGQRGASIMLNGTIVTTSDEGANAVANDMEGSDIINAATENDYIQLRPFQNSTTTLAFSVGATKMFLAATYLGA